MGPFKVSNLFNRLKKEHDQVLNTQNELEQIHQKLEVMQEEVSNISYMLKDFLPRGDGRPDHNSQWNIHDVAALRASWTTYDFVEANLLTADTFPDRLTHLRGLSDKVQIPGMVLEFGVGAGSSLLALSETFTDRLIVGFDSFEGLPEDWRTGFEKGFFSDVQIPTNINAKLVRGWFADTLKEFLDSEKDKVALVHLDADLYSSTSYVLEMLTERIQVGTVMVFDEFFNYPGWENHEARAFEEWLLKSEVKVEYLSYVPRHEQLAVRVTGVN
jgi:predicted O-methyltransferase YrrM